MRTRDELSGVDRIERLGNIDVDSGTVAVGDPSYGLVKEPTDKQWRDFVSDRLRDRVGDAYLIPHKMGHQGRGIVVGTTYGDGSYPVFGLYGDGKLIGLLVRLDDDPTADDEGGDDLR